jgi:uncharacterized membrane protein YdjX (TVP38/TMEM64 family)
MNRKLAHVLCAALLLLLLSHPASSHSFHRSSPFSRPNGATAQFVFRKGGTLAHHALALHFRGGNVDDSTAVAVVAETVAEAVMHVGGVDSKSVASDNVEGSDTYASSATTLSPSWKSKETLRKAAVWTSSGSIVTFLLVKYRHQLFDRQFLQDTTLKYLTAMNENPRGLLYYILGLAAWEAIGLPTIPIETAAGMAFGKNRAILASTCGKMSGAATAFLLGRHILQRWVRAKLQQNAQFQLIESSVEHSPTKTAILLKYSVFPEFIKNYGTALLNPIPLTTFLFATLVHGGPFTCLWSWLGDDTSLHLANPDLPPNRAVQVTVVVAMTVGVILSPIAMGWWIASLRKEQQQQEVLAGILPSL